MIFIFQSILNVLGIFSIILKFFNLFKVSIFRQSLSLYLLCCVFASNNCYIHYNSTFYRTFSVAALDIEEPESLVSGPESSPEVVPRKGADSGAPSPPPQPASLDSSSSSSGAPSSTVSETINESISEGQWLMDRSEGELPRSHYSHKGQYCN